MDPYLEAASQAMGGAQQQGGEDPYLAAASQAMSAAPAPAPAQPSKQAMVAPPPPTIPGTNQQVNMQVQGNMVAPPPPGGGAPMQGAPPPQQLGVPRTGVPQPGNIGAAMQQARSPQPNAMAAALTPEPKAKKPAQIKKAPVKTQDQKTMEGIYNRATQLPYGIGGAVKDIGTSVQNAQKAGAEFQKPGNQLTAGLSAGAGGVEGLIRGVEEPFAAIGGLAGMGLRKMGYKGPLIKEPNIAGQYRDNPDVKKAREANPGSYDTGSLVGNLGTSLAEFGAGGKIASMGSKAALKALAKKSGPAAEAATQMLKGANKLAQIQKKGGVAGKSLDVASGAAAGAGLNAASEAGQHVMAGEAPKVTGENLAKGAVMGGGLAALHAGTRDTTKVDARAAKRAVSNLRKPKPSAPPPPADVPLVGYDANANKNPINMGHNTPAWDANLGTPSQHVPEGPKLIEHSKYEHSLMDSPPSYIPLKGAPKEQYSRANVTEPTPDQVRRAQEIQEAQGPGSGKDKTNGEKRTVTNVRKPVPSNGPLLGYDRNANKNPIFMGHNTPLWGSDLGAPNSEHIVDAEIVHPDSNPEPKVETPKHTQKFYEQTGRAPIEDKPVTPPPEDTRFHDRQSVPASQVFEQHPETGRYSEPFDATNPAARPVKWNGVVHGAKPHPTEAGQATIGGIIGGKGAARKKAVLDALERGTAVSQQLRDTGVGHTDAQLYANARGRQEALRGNTGAEQSSALDSAASKNSRKISEIMGKSSGDDIQATIEALQGGFSSKKKMTTTNADLTGGIANILAEGPGRVTADLKNQVGKFKRGEGVYQLKHLFDPSDTHDNLESGANRNGSDFVNRLHGMLSKQAMDMHGVDVSSGQFGAEARHAMRNLTLDEILDPDVTPDWTSEQRTAVAKMKHFQAGLKQMVNDELATHGEDADYARALREVSKQVSPGERTNADRAFDWLSGHMYNVALGKNPVFHALQMGHTFQVGSAVTGPVNIWKAWNLKLRDPKVKTFLENSKNLTTDFHDTMRWDNAFSEGKSVPKDLYHSSQWNNEVTMLAGMLKHSKGDVGELHGMIDRLNRGEQPTVKDGDMMLSGLNALREATGNLPGAKNMIFTQRSAAFRFLAQLSGYRAIVSRLAIKSAGELGNPATRAAGAGKLGTLLASTALMGGSAVVPQEVREGLWSANPQLMYGFEKMADGMNVLGNVSGRVLTDHMRFSLDNWGVNLSIQEKERLERTMAQQWDDTKDMEAGTRGAAFMARLAWELPASAWGVGTSTIRRTVKNFQAAGEGKKKVFAYDKNKKLATGSRDYNYVDALADSGLAGQDKEEHNFKHKAFVRDKFKRAGLAEPTDLEASYPTPHIH